MFCLVFHNLNIIEIERSLKQINKIAKKSFIMVESYRSEKELFNLQCWALTCDSFLLHRMEIYFQKTRIKVILNSFIFKFKNLK